jgi:hypothetical protein
MTNASGQTGKLERVSVLAGWAKAIAARFTGANELREVSRAEFEEIAQDLNLPPLELYGLLTGRRVSADALEQCLAAELAASPQLAERLRAIERRYRAARIRASVPIGPSCC